MDYGKAMFGSSSGKGRRRSKKSDTDLADFLERARDTSANIVIGATAAAGLVTNPAPPADTDQLEDSRQSQTDRNNSSTEEASNQRSRPGTNRRK